MLDLLLINPSDKKKMYGELSKEYSAVEPPLWIGLLASFIRERNFSVKIIDMEALNLSFDKVLKKIKKEKPLLVGIGVLGANPSASSTPKMDATKRIVKFLKDSVSNLKVFLFGIHPSSLPHRTLEEEKVDFICRGEPFYTVLELLKVLKNKEEEKLKIENLKNIQGLWFKENGKIQENGWGKLIENLDVLPFVSWDLLPMEKYRAHNWHCFGRLNKRSPYGVIYTSLGCPYDCFYCNIHFLYDGKPKIRFRSIKKAVEEIGYLVENYNIENIKILDELFFLDKNRVEEFCDLIIEKKYNLNMWAYARIDTIDKKLLKKIKKAGINWLCFGIESADERVRKDVAKGDFSYKKIKDIIDIVHKEDIYIVANFIFGLPEDNLETMQKTLRLAVELNCEYTNFYTAMAYPGSKLYEYAINNNIPLPSSWIGYSQFSYETFPLPTKYLTNREVLKFRDEAFLKYHSSPKYLKMIEKKFGVYTVEHIKKMVKYKIKRRLLEEDDYDNQQNPF